MSGKMRNDRCTNRIDWFLCLRHPHGDGMVEGSLGLDCLLLLFFEGSCEDRFRGVEEP